MLDAFVVISNSGTNDIYKHFKPKDIQLKMIKNSIDFDMSYRQSIIYQLLFVAEKNDDLKNNL